MICMLPARRMGRSLPSLERGGSAASQRVAEIGCSRCQRGAILVNPAIVAGLARAAAALKKVDQLHLCTQISENSLQYHKTNDTGHAVFF